ncbi:MAG: hypothetical protein HN335_02160, partial [Anaerolineae bacterium]|nr:hypothetical protein [Anaerolineae bacterium]
PSWMQTSSQTLPLTRGIASARTLIAGGSLADVAPLLLGEIGIGIIYGWLGYILFKWFEIQAKRKGSLETV